MIPVRGLRRAAISAFIVVCLATQTLQNLALTYFPDPAAAGGLAGVANQARWGFEQFGFWTGTNTYWRMFSPIHKYDWWWRVFAFEPDGSWREIASPSVSSRSSLESFFVDYRETKLLLNLWTRPPMQTAYIEHRCREERAAGRAPARIQLMLQWRPILPPHEALERGDHRGTEIGTSLMAEGRCT